MSSSTTSAMTMRRGHRQRERLVPVIAMAGHRRSGAHKRARPDLWPARFRELHRYNVFRYGQHFRQPVAAAPRVGGGRGVDAVRPVFYAGVVFVGAAAVSEPPGRGGPGPGGVDNAGAEAAWV